MASQTGTLEEGQVRAMFDRIAGVYDRMNAVMTAGLDRRWRSRAADPAAVAPGDRVLDVATGTGDLALELARRVGGRRRGRGVGLREAMLERARDKPPAGRTCASNGRRAGARPPDGAFAAATVVFGARDFSTPSGHGRDATRRAAGWASRRPRDHDPDQTRRCNPVLKRLRFDLDGARLSAWTPATLRLDL